MDEQTFRRILTLGSEKTEPEKTPKGKAVPARKSVLGDVMAGTASGAARVLPQVVGAAGDIEMLLKLPAYKASQELMGLPEEQKAELRGLEILGSPVGRMVDEPVETPRPVMPTSEQVMSGIESVVPAAETAFRYEPETGAGRAAQTVTEFVGGGLPGLLTKTKKGIAALTGLGGLLAGAEEAGMGEAGAAAVTALPLAVQTFRGRPTAMERYLGDIPLGDVAEAKALRQRSKELGMPLTPFEVLDVEASVVGSDVARMAEAAPELRGILGAREQALPKVTDEVADIIADAIDDPALLASQIKSEGNAALRYGQKIKSDIAGQAGYEAAKIQKAPSNTLTQLMQRAGKRAADSSDPQAVTKAAEDILGTKVGTQKGFRNTFAPKSIEAIDKKVAQYKQSPDYDIRSLANSIDEALLKNNPNIVAARKADMSAREDLVSSIGRDFMGALETELGPTQMKNLLFGEAVTPTTIKKISNTLANQAKRTDGVDRFPEMARFLFDSKIAQSAQKGLRSGSDFVKSIRGQEGTALYKKYDTILENVAKSKGYLDPSEISAYKSSVNEIMDVLERTGSVNGFRSIPQATGELAGKPGIRMATNETNRAISILEFMSNRRNVLNQKALTKVLTSKDGVDELIKLAKSNKSERQRSDTIRNLIIAAREGVELEEGGEEVSQVESGLLGE